MSDDHRVDWDDHYRAIIIGLRRLLADDRIHPCGHAIACEYLTELMDAAAHGDHVDALRLQQMIEQRVADELCWHREKIRTIVEMRRRRGRGGAATAATAGGAPTSSLEVVRRDQTGNPDEDDGGDEAA
jgi:hypothetical protein